MNGDVVNGGFEAVGALLTWLNVRQLARDRQVRGVRWWFTGFWLSWGFWNLWYYPSLGQWLSFTAGVALAAGNVVWFALAWRFRHA